MDFQTLCIHGNDKHYDNSGAICVPIFASATYAHPGVGQSTGYTYSRIQNPTREHLERTVAALEGASDAIAFSSGMSAVSALMEIFEPGDHIVSSGDLYGGTYRLFNQINKKNGLKFSFAGTAEEITASVVPETKAIFIETPTNPMMHVIDIAGAAKIAKEHGILLIVDNTFLTPYFQKPLALGADVVLHSGTKYLGGHNDTLAGILAVKEPELSEKIRFVSKTTGAVLSPFDSYLIIRGIKTLAVRMEKQQETALAIAGWLTGREEITSVNYIGLPSHPGYETNKRQSSGYGGMISFSVRSGLMAVKILESVKIIQYAESLGGAESLITYPMLQTHKDMPESERNARGIDSCLLRLSVGLESANDLISDLEHALTRDYTPSYQSSLCCDACSGCCMSSGKIPDIEICKTLASSVR